ncbi:glycosyltransferase [Runella sp.]|uniref:glycosyltransferase n=1 Tax=Runella sp. TaxID=1960881 RepID=UPI00301AA56E
MSVINPSSDEGLKAAPRILVAPLNWGLGHATRCIPLIKALERMGASVYLASDGTALELLKAEFPHLPALELPSYRIRYGHGNMVLNIGRQLPRIIYAVRSEQWVTERLIQEHQIQGIISDNRYGCFSPKTPSVLLTHQINLKIPNKLLEWSANRVLRLVLAKFNAIWIPDTPEAPGLSGALSHGASRHPDVCYIGILSRMEKYQKADEYEVAIVLSGPEPQRSFLENKLLEQAIDLPGRCIVVRGKTNTKEHYFAAEHIEVVSYLTARDLNEVLLSSKVVVCRSGYSSIMDLAVLGKKALLIPTPGQTEQEYLADFWAEQGYFLVQEQEKIDLEAALTQMVSTKGLPADQFDPQEFEKHLSAWVNKLQ